LPRYLPEYIEVDLLKLQLGQSLHLSELAVPEGVKLVALAHAHDTTVVMVYKPRAAEEEAPVAAAPAEGEAAAPATGAEADKGKGDKG
jgi:large subunit ribosomal protein L25